MAGTLAKPKLSQLKPLITLAVFLGAWFVLPPVLKNTLRNTLNEFQAPLWLGSSYVRDLQTTLNLQVRSKRALAEAVRDLSRENAYYRLELQRRRDLEAYTGRLEDLLELPSRPAYRYEVARVIRRDLSAWWQQIVIRKGRDFGIYEGAAVVFEGGVVGRVARVHPYTSEVELITSPSFRMAVHFKNDSRPITYQGRLYTNFSQPFGKISNVPPDISVTAGNASELVSSRLGGTFPAGLTVGRIHRLQPGRDGLFQAGTVSLDPRLLTLQEVAVAIPLIPAEEPFPPDSE